MPKPYGEDSSNSQLSHWIDRAVQAEFRAEKFETALSKEVLAVIQKAAQAPVPDHVKQAAEAMFNAGTKAWLDRKPINLAVPEIEPCQESWSESLDRRLDGLASEVRACKDNGQNLRQRVDTHRDDIYHLIRRVEALEAKVARLEANR